MENVKLKAKMAEDRAFEEIEMLPGPLISSAGSRYTVNREQLILKVKRTCAEDLEWKLKTAKGRAHEEIEELPGLVGLLTPILKLKFGV